MKIDFVKATETDADKFVEVQNKSFYADYLKYGECPGYGRTAESIVESMNRSFAYTYRIMADGEIIGKISASEKTNGEYYLNCLCVIPQYENRGIGQQAVSFIEGQFQESRKWSLETPADNLRNHHFYQKCGYRITDKKMDGNVEIVVFSK